MGLRGGADRYDPKDPSEDGVCLRDVVDMDVYPGLIGLGDAFDTFSGEQILNVRNEPVSELAAHESALQGELPKTNQEDHDSRTVRGPIFSG